MILFVTSLHFQASEDPQAQAIMENGENLYVESQTGGEEEEDGDTRGLTRSALGPAVGEIFSLQSCET